MGMSPNHLGGGGNGLHRPLAEINVTPLVDVMLVLLIVFMITAPMLTPGMKINLPQAKSARQLDPKEPIVVTVSQDGKVSFGADEMEIPALVEALIAKTGGDATRVIQIRADRDANYGGVVSVIDALSSNGMTHVALVTDPKARAESSGTVRTSATPITAGATVP